MQNKTRSSAVVAGRYLLSGTWAWIRRVDAQSVPHQRILQLLFLGFLTTSTRPPGRSCLDSRCCFIAISWPTAVFTANSKTSSTPFISLLLHSTYMAPICFATLWPCSGVTGVRPWVLRRSMHTRLVRRSDLSPTRMSGVVGQKWRTSGYHYMICDQQMMSPTMGWTSIPYP